MIFVQAFGVKRLHGEEVLQRAVFQWIFYQETRYPVLRYALHVPNGGKRSKAEAGALKACGVRSGVPDILIPIKNGRYAGLAIELKYGKNRVTENQNQWLGTLEKAGYLTGVAYDLDKAIEIISVYLDFNSPCKTTLVEPSISLASGEDHGNEKNEDSNKNQSVLSRNG